MEQIDERVRKAGLTSFLNSRDGIALNQPDDVLPIFKEDVREVLRADVVVASLNGVAVDSGTAWEIAWAWSQGKHLVGVYTDWRLHYKWQTVNLMIQCSLDKIVRSLDELESYLKLYLRAVEGRPAGGAPIPPHQAGASPAPGAAPETPFTRPAFGGTRVSAGGDGAEQRRGDFNPFAGGPDSGGRPPA